MNFEIDSNNLVKSIKFDEQNDTKVPIRRSSSFVELIKKEQDH